MAEKLHCVFCGKSEDEVETLIAAPKISICCECIGLMSEMVAKGNPRWRAHQIEVLSKLKETEVSARLPRD
jgi:ATP-dependent Clp protease ATP-binding subunit ClpX